MRNLDELNEYRYMNPHVQAWGDHTAGAFFIPSKIDGKKLNVIASAGHRGWDHVSVSHPKRVPNWYEMQQIHRLFFKPDETAIEYHVPPTDHVNNNANVLHLWRPCDVELPRPPAIMVGLQQLGTLVERAGRLERVGALAALALGALLMLGSGVAEARPSCGPGKVWRPSMGICQWKATAVRAGVYRPRVARASIKHRYKRPPVKRASIVQKAQTAPASSMQEVHKITPTDAPAWVGSLLLVEPQP
jgi:hypothetical protein